MKNIYKKLNLLCAALLSFAVLGCSDFLEEENKSRETDVVASSNPAFFDQLVAEVYNRMRAVTSSYDLEFLGTDIFTRGDIIAGINEINDYVNLRPVNGSVSNQWFVNYRVIAASNAAIDRSEEIVGLTDAAKEIGLAEAKFFRAYAYFNLVEHFGGVPLDLGGGELKFNIFPSRSSKRNTVPLSDAPPPPVPGPDRRNCRSHKAHCAQSGRARSA